MSATRCWNGRKSSAEQSGDSNRRMDTIPEVESQRHLSVVKPVIKFVDLVDPKQVKEEGEMDFDNVVLTDAQ